MVQLNRELVVTQSADELWKRLNDPVLLGKCIPGCESVSVIDQDTSRWIVKMSVGVISRKIDAKAKVVEKNEGEKTLVVKFNSADGDFTGTFKIRVRDDAGKLGSSTLNLDTEIEARGSFQWIVNQVIKSQLDKFSSEFTRCISA
ncbi:MAG TPA: SRPBCC domain-containing protein [Nitrososphaerales archaeon]|nr:SRPBCC domain-containing protein [Nitrososphaerales archaeon]